MPLKNRFRLEKKQKSTVSLRTVLTIPFLVQIILAVGLVGYFSFHNGQKAVQELASALMGQISARIDEHLNAYLAAPDFINQSNGRAIKLGLLDVNNPLQLERHFWNQAQTFPLVSFIYYGNTQGGLVLAGYDENSKLIVRSSQDFVKGNYHKYTLNEQGEHQKIIDTTIYDARQRPWYIAATQAKKSIWSQVYPFVSTQTPGITLSQPVYDSQGTLQGVLGVDLSLTKTSEFLSNLQVGKTGSTLIIERSGNMIASSLERPFISINNSEDVQRINITHSQIPVVKSAAHYLQKQYQNFQKIDRSQQIIFTNQQQRYFLQVTPLKNTHGLDWLILVIVPEQDFMEQIHANTRTTILLCLATLIIAMIVATLITHWLTKPILRLNQAAKELAQGNWNKVIESQKISEISQLAEAFNQMSEKLKISFTELEKDIMILMDI